MIQRIASHWQDARKLLLEQYKDSPRYLAILEAVISQGDHVEDLLWSVAYCLDMTGRVSELPTGPRLDRVGQVAGVDRFYGEDDQAYLQRIRVEVGLANAGTPEEVLRIARSFTGDPKPLYIPEYPAGFVLYTAEPKAYLTQNLVDRISPAGVQGYIGCCLVDALGNPIFNANAGHILIVGNRNYIPENLVWDGGVGSIDPSAAVLASALPFRDSNGVGEYPDADSGPINPVDYTFQNGTYADDMENV